MKITIEPLDQEQFRPYGQVIQHDAGAGKSANQGTASRTNFLAKLQNLRSDALPNICVFKVNPAELPFSVKLLERYA